MESGQETSEYAGVRENFELVVPYCALTPVVTLDILSESSAALPVLLNLFPIHICQPLRMSYHLVKFFIFCADLWRRMDTIQALGVGAKGSSNLCNF